MITCNNAQNALGNLKGTWMWKTFLFVAMHSFSIAQKALTVSNGVVLALAVLHSQILKDDVGFVRDSLQASWLGMCQPRAAFQIKSQKSANYWE